MEKADEILNCLIDLAHTEATKAKERGYFSKEFAEACGIVVSLAYGRWRK